MPLQTAFGCKVSDKGATQLFALDTLRIEGACVYKYVKAYAAIDQYDGVAYQAVGTVDDASVGSGSPCAGVAHVALAANDYGWIQVSGPLAVGTLAGTAGVPVYATASTGALTTTSTGNSAALGSLGAANNIFINCM